MPEAAWWVPVDCCSPESSHTAPAAAPLVDGQARLAAVAAVQTVHAHAATRADLPELAPRTGRAPESSSIPPGRSTHSGSACSNASPMSV
jgi:hypothetical protein